MTDYNVCDIVGVMIKRHLEKELLESLKSGKITVLYGARQVGKTTLANKVMRYYKNPYYLSCDLLKNIALLKPDSLERLSSLVKGHDLIVIDEAQKSPDIGLTLKIFHDQIPEVSVLATGSSSLDLASRVKEPLTGRSNELILLPFSVNEMYADRFSLDISLELSMLYGGYPEVVGVSTEKKVKFLTSMADGYLYKDVFNHDTVFDQFILESVVRLLAYQIGSEVSYNKIANTLDIGKNTVARYVDLLEKAMIVFRVHQYRRNQRKEVGRLRKVYFYDLGIRNGVINNFEPLVSRIDKGALWENFMMVERLKKNQYDGKYTRNYYWRSDRGQEVDLVEETQSIVNGFEFKSGAENPSAPSNFLEQYPHAKYKVINKNNYLDFIF